MPYLSGDASVDSLPVIDDVPMVNLMLPVQLLQGGQICGKVDRGQLLLQRKNWYHAGEATKAVEKPDSQKTQAQFQTRKTRA